MSAELEQLKNDMKRLKITEAAAVVEERLLEAQVTEPSYQVFLTNLVQHEIKKREEKQLGRLYKLAAFLFLPTQTVRKLMLLPDRELLDIMAIS